MERPRLKAHFLTEVVDGLAAGTRIVTGGSYWLKADFLQDAIPDEG